MSPLLAHTARQAIRVEFKRGSFSLEESSLGSARGAKSQQGSRTGRCGWITSFYIHWQAPRIRALNIFLVFYSKKINIKYE